MRRRKIAFYIAADTALVNKPPWPITFDPVSGQGTPAAAAAEAEAMMLLRLLWRGYEAAAAEWWCYDAAAVTVL